MISYAKLWHLLDRRGLHPRDLVYLPGISPSTLRVMKKDEHVRLDVLQRICGSLNVDIGDVCSFRTRM